MVLLAGRSDLYFKRSIQGVELKSVVQTHIAGFGPREKEEKKSRLFLERFFSSYNESEVQEF